MVVNRIIKFIWKKFNITTEQFGEMALVAAVLAFCFSFRDWGEPFSWMVGFNNFIITLFVVAFSIAVHDLGHRFIGKSLGSEIEFKMWPMGLVLAIILVFLTNGYFIFAAAWTITITVDSLLRSKFKKAHLGPYEQAKIALSGPIASIFLAIFARLFSEGSYIFTKLMYVNVWLAAFNMIPFFSILFASYRLRGHAVIKSELMPRMEGEYVFFGSRPLWFFSFAFMLLCGISLFVFSAGISFVIGLLCGVALYLIYHYFSIFKWS